MQTSDKNRATPPTRTTRALIRVTGLLAGKQVSQLTNLHITDIHTECFAAEWTQHGRRHSVVCWRGQNYVPQRTGLRIRLHNRLVSLISARHPNGVAQ